MKGLVGETRQKESVERLMNSIGNTLHKMIIMLKDRLRKTDSMKNSTNTNTRTYILDKQTTQTTNKTKTQKVHHCLRRY